MLRSYLMGELRLVLDTEVEAGKQVHSMYSLPGLERLLDGMQHQEWPVLVRGDRHYGTERVMTVLEARGQDYLFKLLLRPRVKALVAQLASEEGWQHVGRGWQAAESKLLLEGWTRARRVVVLRRQVRKRKQPGASQARAAAAVAGGRAPDGGPAVPGPGRRGECVRRVEEPLGLGRVHDPGPEAHADHGADERAVLQLVVGICADDRSGHPTGSQS